MSDRDSLADAIVQALAPAKIDQVFLYPWLKKALVLVSADQLSAAIGPRAETVGRASQELSVAIEVMTQSDLAEQQALAKVQFGGLPLATTELVDRLLAQGVLYLEDLTVVDEETLARAIEVDHYTAGQWIAHAQGITRG